MIRCWQNCSCSCLFGCHFSFFLSIFILFPLFC